MARPGPIARLLAGRTAAAREVLAAEAAELPGPAPHQVGPLIGLAAGGETPAPRAARWLLAAWRLGDPQALPRILKALLQAPSSAREAAGLWLFWPEAADELPLRRQLCQQAGALLDLAVCRPGPWLRDGLAEVLGQRGGEPLRRLLDLAHQQDWARRVVALLPAELRLPGGWPPGLWLVRQEVGSACLARLRRLARAGRWSAIAGLPSGEMALTRHLAGYSPAAQTGRPLAWPAGPKSLAVLERMAVLTAAEGLAAWRVAERVSRRLDRVVLLLGNASLGGPPLWAVASPGQQGAASLPPDRPRPSRGMVQDLARLRARRLGGGHLLRCLWELRTAVGVAQRGRNDLETLLAQALPWLESGKIEALRQGRLGLALGGLPLAPALGRARGALERCRSLEAQARQALNLVYGLAAAGRPPLVLPWADKFAASTAKAGDHAYLARLTALLARLSPPPLLLLVDQTAHPGFPSLVRVLTRAGRSQPGLVLRGVGCYAGRARPRDLGGAVLRAARGANLVALRPAPGAHPAAELARAAAGLDRRPLAPASRDGAAWLLAGSGLAPLADPSAPRLPGEPPPWLLTDQGFAPLGGWLRGRVAALAGRQEPRAGPWLRYQRLCGLD